VDTQRAGGFRLPFGLFFQARRQRHHVSFNPSPLLLEELSQLDVFPSCLMSRVHSYEAAYDHQVGNFVDSATGERLGFDLQRDHPHALLVHEQCGGGRVGMRCLDALELTNDFRRHVLSRLRPLAGLNHLAAVVRNATDYQTDYEAFFRSIKAESAGKHLLVCSDDPTVLRHARQTLCETNVIELEWQPENVGKPLAYWSASAPPLDRYRLVVKSVSDLLGLACSKRLFASTLSPGVKGAGGVSGFVQLASDLHRHRSVVRRLLLPQG